MHTATTSPSKSVAGSASGCERRAHTPHVNHHAALTNFSHTFRAVEYATGSLLHHEPGRSVRHNLRRLPSPKPNHDFATSILLGGNHPQNKFRYLNKSFRRTVDILQSTGDDDDRASDHQQQRDHSGGSSDAAFLDFQRRCAEEARFEREVMKLKVQHRRQGTETSKPPLAVASRALTPAGVGVGGSRTELEPVRGGGVPLPSALAASRPGTQMSNRTATFAASVVDSGSRPATRQQQHALSHLPDNATSLPPSRGASRQSQRSVGSAATSVSTFTPPHLRQKQKTWEELQEFSLNINGDYETPFLNKDEEQNLDNTKFVRGELVRFDSREAEKRDLDANEQFINTLSTLPQSTFTPPKIILMMFKFANVRNLASTTAMRRIGYPELHEQFSTAAKNGVITKAQYQKVLAKYLSAAEMLDAHKIIQCFDRNALGDVDLNMFLIGLQILLDCATPGDTMRYCFTLMDANNKIPRYITRYEVQTLVGYAAESGSGPGDGGDDVYRVDTEFERMNTAIRELLDEAERYDYMGRMPLKEFLDQLNEKVVRADRESSPSGSAARAKERERKGQFMFGNVWQGAPVVAAVHRMSSKKMLYASLAPKGNTAADGPRARSGSLTSEGL